MERLKEPLCFCQYDVAQNRKSRPLLLIHKVLLSDTLLINNHGAAHPETCWQSFIFHAEPRDSLCDPPGEPPVALSDSGLGARGSEGEKRIPAKVKGQKKTESSRKMNVL